MTRVPIAVQDTSLPADFFSIARRLDAVGYRFRLANILGAAAKFLGITVPLTTGILFLVGSFSLAPWLNIALLLVTVAAWAIAYKRLLHKALFHRPTYAEIARLIEEHAPAANLSLNNELINAILLANDLQQTPTAPTTPTANTAWIPHVLRELASSTNPLPLEKAVPWKEPRRVGIAAGAMLLVCLLAIVTYPTAFAHGLAVFARPTVFVPIQGAVRIVGVEPGNDTVLAGQSLNFTVTVDSPHNKIVPTRIGMVFASGKSVSYPMSVFGSENNQYRYQLPTAAEDVDYIITSGDSQSDRFHITVLPQIHMLRFKLEAVPPAYTGREKLLLTLAGRDATAGKASIVAPVGSAVTLSVAVDLPAKEVLLDMANASPIAMTPAADGKTFTTSFTLKETLQYVVRVNDSANRTLRTFPSDTPDPAATTSAVAPSGNAQQYAITATPDQAPTITVTDPAKDIDAKPGDKLALAASAADDYGLTRITLEAAKNDDKDFRAIQSWPMPREKDGKPTRAVGIKYVLDLPAIDYQLGDTLRYRFVATDNRDLTSLQETMGAQSTPSQVFTIAFNDTAAAAAKTTKLWDELRKQLGALLDRQVALRKQANDLTMKVTLEQMRGIATPIGEGQKSLRADMAKIAKDFPFETSMKLIQKSLQVLVVEDATAAIDRSSDILLLSETKPMGPLAVHLREHQDRIIDALQALLAIAQADENHVAKVMDKNGEDLPNEAKDAWKKIADDLQKFEKEQKAVIDSSAELAKKPKDQYDQKDNQKIADLAAVEDKWEKFLNDRLADMSKIAEQDQANASLLDEMVQMKVELAAAKDALEQKATEVATPLEENGLENAKVLDAHIERMLMNKPDHTAWQMEEPVTQNDPAMAELPKQLQDMVGDLMDKEEDLTDEMESVGSKFADSLNKGAGWDATDGPISNMSAQGVTGNQMPKNEEIQGRSGEGREGKSSGEFVGSEAEGKGGRRTPTRMTEDPFSSGQVNDKSKDPAGGATGGGKKGGFGGEGLEGQAPAEVQDAIKRLTGMQAALRNQGERINLQMHATGFNNFKLIEANVLLKKSEDALRQYHYQNALYYQQQAVQSLNTAKVLSAGQLHVTLDSTPQVSEKTQKEIDSAMNSAMPKGYVDPVKAYFQKLANDHSNQNP